MVILDISIIEILDDSIPIKLIITTAEVAIIRPLIFFAPMNLSIDIFSRYGVNNPLIIIIIIKKIIKNTLALNGFKYFINLKNISLFDLLVIFSS